MNHTSIFRRALSAFAVFALVATTAACDNPVGQDDDHLEARGVVITDMAGAMIAETHGDHWDFTSGSEIHLHPGKEMEVRVYFVDPAGNRFQVGSLTGYQLVVQVANPSIVTYGGHGDHGHFEALGTGETTAVIHLWHGNHPSGHADYSSPALAIDVDGHGTH
ncbi:MAG: hypothetical protein H0U67_07940 [Gemmatimonadetes bacterium]|nr:hypothetical protein [Gemmatimonadota bacterium]